MRVATPPRGPDIEHERDLEQRVADLEALIEEARRRARRRRRVYAALALCALGAAAWAAFGIGGGGRASLGRSAPGGPARASAAQASAARWQPLHGPEGGEIFAIAIDPADSKIVYAGGWGNLFKSTDGGGRWKRCDQRAMDAGRGDRDRSDAAERRLRGHGPRRRQDDGRRPALAHGQQRALRRQGGAAPTRRESRRERRLVADHRCAASEHRVRDDGPRPVPNDQRWQALADHRAGPFPKRILPALRGHSLGLRHCPSRSTRTTLRPSTRAGRVAGFRPTSSRAPTAATSWRRITMPEPLSFSVLALTASGALLGTDASRPGVYRSTDGGTTWSPSGAPGEHVRRAHGGSRKRHDLRDDQRAERCSRRPTAETAGRRPPPTSPTARS